MENLNFKEFEVFYNKKPLDKIKSKISLLMNNKILKSDNLYLASAKFNNNDFYILKNKNKLIIEIINKDSNNIKDNINNNKENISNDINNNKDSNNIKDNINNNKENISNDIKDSNNKDNKDDINNNKDNNKDNIKDNKDININILESYFENKKGFTYEIIPENIGLTILQNIFIENCSLDTAIFKYEGFHLFTRSNKNKLEIKSCFSEKFNSVDLLFNFSSLLNKVKEVNFYNKDLATFLNDRNEDEEKGIEEKKEKIFVDESLGPISYEKFKELKKGIEIYFTGKDQKTKCFYMNNIKNNNVEKMVKRLKNENFLFVKFVFKIVTIHFEKEENKKTIFLDWKPENIIDGSLVKTSEIFINSFFK